MIGLQKSPSMQFFDMQTRCSQENNQQESMIWQPTSRLHSIYENSKIAENLFDKSTQRKPIQYINKHPLWMSQSPSQKSQRKQWFLPSNLRQIELMQQKKQMLIQLLNKNGVLQLLQFFESFRDYMIENYYTTDKKGNANKIQLIKWIEELKYKTNRVSYNVEIKSQINDQQKQDRSVDYSQMKQLLLNLAQMRNQNTRLRTVIKNLHSKIRQLKDQSHLQDDSIMNNSISFHSQTSRQSELDQQQCNKDDLFIMHDQQSESSIIDEWNQREDSKICNSRSSQILDQSYMISRVDTAINCNILQQQTLQLSTKESKVELLSNITNKIFISYQENKNSKVYQNKNQKISRLQRCLERSIVKLKNMLHSYLLSANIVLAKSESFEEFKQLIKQLKYVPTKKYETTSDQQLQPQEIQRFINHISTLSESINQLVKKQVKRIKKI